MIPIPDTWIDAIASFGAFVIVIFTLQKTFGLFERILTIWGEQHKSKGDES